MRAADGDIRAELTGRLEQREREQVRRDDDERARCVRLLRKRREVVDRSIRGGILHQHAARLRIRRERGEVTHDRLDAERLRARVDDLDGLRMAMVGDEEGVALLGFLDAMAEHHRLGGAGALVEHGGIGDLQTGEIADHRLEVEEHFQAALRNLRLIRRVLRVPAGVLENVPLDDGRRDAVVVAKAEVTAEHLVLLRDGAELLERLELALRRRQIERAFEADRLGHRLIDERVE